MITELIKRKEKKLNKKGKSCVMIKHFLAFKLYADYKLYNANTQENIDIEQYNNLNACKAIQMHILTH